LLTINIQKIILSKYLQLTTRGYLRKTHLRNTFQTNTLKQKEKKKNTDFSNKTTSHKTSLKSQEEFATQSQKKLTRIHIPSFPSCTLRINYRYHRNIRNAKERTNES
jgi:hypothetical protein